MRSRLSQAALIGQAGAAGLLRLSQCSLRTRDGCTMAPRYERPAAPVECDLPRRWPAARQCRRRPATQRRTPPASATSAPRPPRRSAGAASSPIRSCRRSIQRALANNRDLRVATLNVEAAQRELPHPACGASCHPSNAQGAANSQRLPASVSQFQRDIVFRQYSAGLGVTAFELDLFGRVRSLRKRALEEFLSHRGDTAERAAVAGLRSGECVAHADRGSRAAEAHAGDPAESAKLVRISPSCDSTQGVSSEIDLHQAGDRRCARPR